MKNINFKRSESVLKGLEIRAEVNKRGKINWDRIIYFGLLIIILFLFFRYLVNEIFFLEGDGQVRFENISIRNTDDCRIVKIYFREGDDVKIGDSLFSYIIDDEDYAVEDVSVYGASGISKKSISQGDVSWSEKEVFKVREQIKVNNFLIAEKVKLKNIYTAELERIRNEVMLDALPRNKLDDQLSKINQLNFDIQSLTGKTSMLSASLNQLEGMKRDLSSVVADSGQGSVGQSNNSRQKVFYSPITGVVTTIMKNEFEVALKTEEIMSIHKPENISIRGFFDQEDLASIKIGDRVDLRFPDGSVGRGIIKRLYFATYKLPEEFQKKYEPTTRSLAVDIYAETIKDLKRWKTFWKMQVKITKKKY